MRRGISINPTTVVEGTHYEQVRARLLEKCNSISEKVLGRRIRGTRRYVPYSDLGCFSTSVVRILTWQYMWLFFYSVLILTPLSVYLIIANCDTATAIVAVTLFLCPMIPVLGLCLLYPFRPTHQIVKFHYYERDTSTSLSEILPNEEEFTELYKKITEYYLDAEASRLCERYLVEKYGEEEFLPTECIGDHFTNTNKMDSVAVVVTTGEKDD